MAIEQISLEKAKIHLRRGNTVYACPNRLKPKTLNGIFLTEVSKDIDNWDQWISIYKEHFCNTLEHGFGIRWYIK